VAIDPRMGPPGRSARCGCFAVLTVAKIAGSGAAAYGQYLEGRTVAAEAGDYYLAGDGERVEAPGRWVLGAQGVETLGVDAARAVGAEQFQALMAVQNPATGAQLRAGGAGGSAVAAIDATFSAPKSVSAVWALASPQLRAGIEAAQERAVDAALEHAIEFVPMVRRRVDRETVLRETPAELLASSWRHTTARAVAGRPPDPQLHSHVVLHGAVRQGDGRVVAIESRAWLVHQREVGAAYRAQLASELRGLGFGIEAGTGRGGRYFELAEVPQGLVERWSGRHHQVRQAIDQRLAERVAELQGQVAGGGPGADAAAGRLAALERSGQLLPAEQRAVAMTTRAAKGEAGLQTAGDLDQAWWQAAREHGFDAHAVEALRGADRAVDVAEPELAIERRILDRLTEFDATFAAREARAVALEAVAGRDPAAGLTALERLRERREILQLADGRETTRRHRGTERVAVAAARALADTPTEAIAPELVDADVAELRSALALDGMQLAVEQEQAMRVACSDRRLTVIVGQAGTGKSTALTGVARTHQAAGQQVIVTSTGAQAAERLTAELAQAGVSAEGYSTAALQAAVRRGAVQLGPDVTVIHDEAALASTREQAWLLQTAAVGGARVIEVGDPRQSGAVGAGGLWPQIETAASERGGLVQLSRIVRAKDGADRRDQARWRAGEHDQALQGYAVRGRVVVESTQRQAEDRALEAAHSDRREGHSALVVVQTSNEQLDGLNARAQALRAQDGELGEQKVALAGRPYWLRAGDEIVLRAASTHPELGAVRNGTRGQVLDVADDGQHATVQLSDGREAGWDRGQLDKASARLGYVSHTWPAQGQTVDRAHVIAGEHADANGTYVALTRARESTRLYASAERLNAERLIDGDQDGGREDQLARLAERLGRSEPEIPSIAVPLAHEQRVERELDEQGASSPRRGDRRPGSDDDVSRRQAPDQRERREQQHAALDQARVERDHASAELERARVQRDQTARVIATMPRDPQIQHTLADARDAAGHAQYAAAQAGQLSGQLGDLGRFARIGEHGRALKAQLAETRDFERQAVERQQRFEQEAESRQVRLAEQRQVWDAQHPGAPQDHQAATRAYEQARDRHQAAEQSYDTLLTQSLVNATAVPSPATRRWPLRPGDALELERPARRPGPERDGPSLGF
jgi:conjugative relaxase-like TrwC/TraI family protein